MLGEVVVHGYPNIQNLRVGVISRYLHDHLLDIILIS